jgi:lipopolysaccharide export LptBFGC system permease protein LptF
VGRWRRFAQALDQVVRRIWRNPRQRWVLTVPVLMFVALALNNGLIAVRRETLVYGILTGIIVFLGVVFFAMLFGRAIVEYRRERDGTGRGSSKSR